MPVTSWHQVACLNYQQRRLEKEYEPGRTKGMLLEYLGVVEANG